MKRLLEERRSNGEKDLILLSVINKSIDIHQRSINVEEKD